MARGSSADTRAARPGASSSSPPEEVARTGSSTTGTSRMPAQGRRDRVHGGCGGEHSDLHRADRGRSKGTLDLGAHQLGRQYARSEQRLMSLRRHRGHGTQRADAQSRERANVGHESRPAAGVAAADDQNRRHSPRASSARLVWPWRCRARAARQARTPLRQHSTTRGCPGQCSCVCSSSSTSDAQRCGKRRDARLGRLRRSITTSAASTSAGAMKASGAPSGSRAPCKAEAPDAQRLEVDRDQASERARLPAQATAPESGAPAARPSRRPRCRARLPARRCRHRAACRETPRGSWAHRRRRRRRSRQARSPRR